MSLRFIVTYIMKKDEKQKLVEYSKNIIKYGKIKLLHK